MTPKEQQRLEDIRECFNWDSKANALTNTWDRGFDYALKEQRKEELEFLKYTQVCTESAMLKRIAQRRGKIKQLQGGKE